jgi:hypothetical protein
MDFTLKTYQSLLKALIKQGYAFQTFQEFIELSEASRYLSRSRAKRVNPINKSIILRHDVDKLPENSLKFAQIQHELGIKGSYYFRIVPENLPNGSQGFNPEIIKQIADLGHEIGFHYETIDLAAKKLKQNSEFRIQNSQNQEKQIAIKAIELFEEQLQTLRNYYPVKTICMHGSPLSKYDNKLLWKYYNYRDFGIIGEPYFDVDFSKVLYLTDTGRRWDGEAVSVRDKVSQNSEFRIQNYKFKKTSDIIAATINEELPDQIMFTFHPQRWTDKPLPWVKELVLQNTKNVVKYFLNKIRK